MLLLCYHDPMVVNGRQIYTDLNIRNSVLYNLPFDQSFLDWPDYNLEHMTRVI